MVKKDKAEDAPSAAEIETALSAHLNEIEREEAPERLLVLARKLERPLLATQG